MYLKLLLVFLAVSYAAPLDDLVTAFPYIPGGKPDFEMYAGYLHIPNTSKYLHYVFVESQNDPTNDPLALWLTGGPGCSAELGFLYEIGPWQFDIGSSDLIENPYSWNKKANMLFIDAPAGVGFSYYLDSEEANTNDYITAHDNLAALLAFFRKFPEYAFHDFYITGESYGGIYIPTLAYNIQLYNENTSSSRINLKGIAVGNGCTDWTVDCDPALMELAFSHALYGYDMYNNFTQYDCFQFTQPDECTDTMNKFNNEIMNNINPYNIYSTCTVTPDGGQARWRNAQPVGEVPPCTDAEGTNKYLRDQTVLDAYHVSSHAFEWTMCTDEPNLKYTCDYERGSYYVYPHLINSGLKILVYSGDVDGSVPTIGTRKWLAKLNLPLKNEFRSWTIAEGQVSGYVQHYEGLTFVTVKGAGHEVPQYKPPEAFHMINTFFADQPI